MKESEGEAEGLRNPEAQAWLRIGQSRSVPAMSWLCEEGRITTSFFVLYAGEVEVAKSVGGEQQLLSTLGPGSTLALLPALDGMPCAVSMRALTDAEVVEIGGASFRALMAAEDAAGSQLGFDLACLAVRRLRSATVELGKALHQAVASPDRAGRIDRSRLMQIQAGNHAWPAHSAKLDPEP